MLHEKKEFKYYSLRSNSVITRVPKGTPKAKERYSDKLKTTVYEKEYKAIEGFITKVEINYTQYGEMLNIYIVDKLNTDDVAVLSVSLNSAYAQSFILLLPKVDFNEPVYIKPYKMQRQDNPEKYNQGVTLYQNGEKVPNIYKVWDDKKKVLVRKNGLEKFDFSKVADNKKKLTLMQIEFQEFLKTILEKVSKKGFYKIEYEEEEEEAIDFEENEEKPDDNLPF